MRPDLRSLYLKAAVVSTGLAICALAAHDFYRAQHGHPVSPAESDNIAVAQVSGFEVRAQQGDCDAAAHLARFHRNVTLDYDASVRWTRVAAKCPGMLFHKEMLLGMYLYEGQRPADAGEIERLLVEVEAAAPERAAQFRAQLAGMEHK